jgi:polyferredoxin
VDDLPGHQLLDRRRVDHVFRRCADPVARFLDRQAAPVAYATVGVLTATTFIFGGFMREQVCIYMCPWPRIQTAMLDEKSLIVTYKDWRGEPRGSVKKAEKTPRCLSAIASIATSASRSARPVSTSATGRRSAASPARCASMPATR